MASELDPRRSRVDAVRATLEQLQSVFLLESLDRLGDGRLDDVQPPGRARHPPELEHRCERAQVTKLHGVETVAASGQSGISRVLTDVNHD